MNNLEKYLKIVNEEKIKRGLESYVPLYPMLRLENGKLSVGVLLTKEDANVWDNFGQVMAEYWVLIDANDKKVLSFNKTSEKEFVVGEIIPKNSESKQIEISKYTVQKTLQYKNYLTEDIRNEQLPLQKKLSSILGNELEIDGENININDYLISNFEREINSKVDELVNVLVRSKYGSITYYYDNIFNQILKVYNDSGDIDLEKLKLCAEIMDNYYDGVIGINNFFNI